MTSSGPRRRAVVAHPGRQHSGRTAVALAEGGLLAGYWFGSGESRPGGPGLAGPPAAGEWVRCAWAPLVRRLLERMVPARSRAWGSLISSRLFDRWASRRLASAEAAAVVGYECGCRRLFETARSLGVRTILDAASLHHETQDRWLRAPESPDLHRRIGALKDRELELADHVLVASELAKRSYREGGFPEERISVVPLGVDVERFHPGPGPGDGFRALFVGKLSETKGFDLLLDAWTGVVDTHPGARLTVAGQGRWRGSLPAGVELLRPSPAELVTAYRSASLLVLPSRLDGFGLVVGEALACGTPVVVSEHVGAGDLVRPGVNGWIVPAGKVEALAARLAWCADHPEPLRAMRPACVDSVKDAGWDAYSRRLLAVVENILEEPAR